jgi:hypothetical protein
MRSSPPQGTIERARSHGASFGCVAIGVVKG